MNRTQILEAVEALRLRKCRPEREAIASHIIRKYGTSFQDVFNDLETLVDQGDLVKVEYKGSISYRSPDAFDTKASPLLTKHSKILNSIRTVRFILTAVTELLSENDSYNKQGIPVEDIQAKLIEYDPSRFTTENTPKLLQREITVGSLVTTESGNLLPKDLQPVSEPSSKVLSSQSGQPKMRGRKPAAVKAAEAESAAAAKATSAPAVVTPTTCASTSLPEIASPSEVFAVKSSPVPVTPTTPGKPVRSYGRKGTASAEKVDKDKVEEVSPRKPSIDKKMPILSSCDEEAVKNGEKDKMPSLILPEDPASGRSVRNKRKKEVFDPSDLPKKRPSVPTPATTPVKTEKEKATVSKTKAVPPPPPQPKPKRPYRKRNKEGAVVEKDTTPATLCEHCQRQKNIRGQVETFLVCSECLISYHPSCLEYDKKQAALLIEKGTWQCSDCKACQVCQEPSVKGPETILCCSCDMGFHYKCLKLVTRPSVVSWLCPGCKGDDEEEELDTKKLKTMKEEVKVTSKKEVISEKEEVKVTPKKEVISEKEEVKVTSKEVISGKEEMEVSVAVTSEEVKEETPEIELNEVTVTVTPTEIVKEEVTPKEEEVKVKPEVEIKAEEETKEVKEEKMEIVEEPPQQTEVAPPKPPVKLGRPPKKRIITLSLDKKSDTGVKKEEDKGQSVSVSSGSGGGGSEERKEDDDLDIPKDASKWTPSHVEAYFKKHGLRDEGILFREQEIDGLSLLLMRRQDIVHGMKLLLGPALKVFKLVAALQQSGGKVESTSTII